jgi:hypothetical protein
MLKKLSLMMSTAMLLALVLASPGWSQQQFPAAAPKAAGLYNPQAVETLAGNVVAVNQIKAKRPGRPERVMMDLKTEKGTIKVHLGPADFLDRQALKLAPGDQVEVKGMRVTRPQVTIFIAGEVKKGGQVLKLRDDATGRPLWAKGKKRNFALPLTS